MKKTFNKQEDKTSNYFETNIRKIPQQSERSSPNFNNNTHHLTENVKINHQITQKNQGFTANKAKELKKPQFLKSLAQPKQQHHVEYDFQNRERQQKQQNTHLKQLENDGFLKQKDSPNKLKAIKNVSMRQTLKGDMSQYQKLTEKLNYLQHKILDVSTNIDKKREEKLKFFEDERRERIKFLSNKNSVVNKSEVAEELKKFVTQVSPHHKDFVVASFNPYSPRHNLYYVSEIIKFYKEEKSLARDHIISSVQFLKIFQSKKVPSLEEISHKIMKLEKKANCQDKKTIVFDLDETLIHCNESLDIGHDVKIKIKFPTGQTIEAGINIRPHAVEMLKALSKNFQIIVFTASHSCYANVVLDHLDPYNEYVHHRLFREHCVLTPEGVYVKDLRVINRDLSQMLLVDNAAYSYVYQLDNAIPILPYYQGKHDYQLKALQNYIEAFIFAKDVRENNKKVFKLRQYTQFDDVEKLVKQLYGEWI